MRVLRWIGILGAAAAIVVAGVRRMDAQAVTTNPFRPLVSWGELPAGRSFGSTSAVEIASDGNIWVVERCGSNTCVGSNVDPVLLFTKEGKLVHLTNAPAGRYSLDLAVTDLATGRNAVRHRDLRVLEGP